MKNKHPGTRELSVVLLLIVVLAVLLLFVFDNNIMSVLKQFLISLI